MSQKYAIFASDMTHRNTYLTLLFFAICLLTPLCDTFAQDSKDARKASALMLEGVQAFESGDTKKAGEKLRAAEALSPKDDAIQYYLGYVEATEGNAASALNHFRAAYDADSTNYWYSMRLSRLYLAMGKVKEAGQINKNLLVHRPNDVNVLSSVVELYIQEGKFDQADSLLTRMNRITGETEYSQMVRLEILRQKGDFKTFFAGMDSIFTSDVIPAASKVKMMDNMLKGSDPRFNFAHLDDYDKLVRTCLKTHPADTAVSHFAAGYYYALDRPDEVIKLCDSSNDDYTLAMYATFACLEKKKDVNMALGYCDKMVSLASTTEDVVAAYTTKADCYQRLNQWDAAFREYERALKVDPGNIVTLNNYAYNLSLTGHNLGKASRMSKKTIEKEPDNATYLDTYAWILFQQKKYQNAKTYLKKAMIYGGKDNPEVLEHYAATLDALGEKAAAEGYRQQAKLKRDAKK